MRNMTTEGEEVPPHSHTYTCETFSSATVTYVQWLVQEKAFWDAHAPSPCTWNTVLSVRWEDKPPHPMCPISTPPCHPHIQTEPGGNL